MPEVGSEPLTPQWGPLCLWCPSHLWAAMPRVWFLTAPFCPSCSFPCGCLCVSAAWALFCPSPGHFQHSRVISRPLGAPVGGGRLRILLCSFSTLLFSSFHFFQNEMWFYLLNLNVYIRLFFLLSYMLKCFHYKSYVLNVKTVIPVTLPTFATLISSASGSSLHCPILPPPKTDDTISFKPLLVL